MTFDNTAWAIDGATTRGALARLAEYAAASGSQGIIQRGDLKVTQLGTPGNGLLISSGGGLVLNGYQGANPNQTYVVSNPASHTVGSSDMPASSGSAQSYILAIVIGDHEFAQTGHPFMGPSDPPSGSEATFQYVRPVMISVSAGATSLSPTIGYPALPLARIDIPASTTVITNAMITDLRALARPRTQIEIGQALSAGAVNVTNTAWQRIPDNPIVTVKVPTWASKAKIMGFLEGMRLHASGNGKVQVYIQSNNRSGEQTNVNEIAPSGTDPRRSYNVGAVIDVSDLGGTTQSFSIRGQANSAGDANFLKTDANTSAMLMVQFVEAPV